MSSGKLIIVSSPSGAGKTTIVKRLLENDDRLDFSISACTREKRLEEEEGKDYYFLTQEEFTAKRNKEEFLEWEEVYENSFYGTLKTEVEKIWEEGKHVVFDIDVLGALSLKDKYPERSLAIFIKPPSLEILKERLKSRSTEKEQALDVRIKKAEFELSYQDQFDRIIENNELETAVEECQGLVNEFISSSVKS